MKNLNKSWLAIIIFGVIFLLGTVAYSLFQSFSGADSDFTQLVNEFPRGSLLTGNVEEHLSN
jgi:flagellar basal body-associated protein FliL